MKANNSPMNILEESNNTATETVEHAYAHLTPEVVIDAVESQGFYCDGRQLALNSYENRVYQVGIEDSTPIIAKFYRPERWSDAQILEEHLFSAELANSEVSAVDPMLNEQQQSLFEYNGFRFALYRRQGGHAPELDNFDHLLSLGRVLGRMHARGAVSKFEHRPAISIESYAIESRDFLLDNNFIPRSLQESYSTLANHLIDQARACFARVEYHNIRLHGDCHPGNILWRDDAPHFVDFDDARSGPAIQDLWMLMSGDRQQQTGQLSEILEGYQEFCDFNYAEISLIEALRTLRIMHYSAWLARRWSDPAFPMNFPWFNTERYWAEHILELREQFSLLQEAPLKLF